MIAPTAWKCSEARILDGVSIIKNPERGHCRNSFMVFSAHNFATNTLICGHAAKRAPTVVLGVLKIFRLPQPAAQLRPAAAYAEPYVSSGTDKSSKHVPDFLGRAIARCCGYRATCPPQKRGSTP